MIKAEQIPNEVIDAAVAMRDRGGSMSDIIRTALNAWPGAFQTTTQINRDPTEVLILPLTQENSNGSD